MVSSTICTVSILIFLVQIQIGTSLKCYHCSTKTNNGLCDPPIDKGQLSIIQCAPKMYCLTTYSEDGDTVEYLRTCESVDYCISPYAKESNVKECLLCDTDLCNEH